MPKREVLFRAVVFALCAALSLAPGGVRAAAMSDAEFVELCRKGAADRIEQALKDGANPDARAEYDKEGEMTALMRAAKYGNLPAVRALLAAGADPGIEDNDGHDALWRARQRGNAEIIRLLEGGAAKPAQAEAGAFDAAELERMSTFISNFTEVRFPDFDMEKGGDDGVLHLGGDPSNPELNRFGILHNAVNNFRSRVRPCPTQGCKHGSLVMDAKFAAESVGKYFDLDLKHQSFDGGDGRLSWHFDGKLYHFEGADGEPVQYAVVKRAVREGGVIRMMGDIYEEDNSGDPPEIIASFVVIAKPHKWNGKDTWAILSLKREWR